jgi:hypothetical protein
MPAQNVIEYITIASAGNATDFGDLLEANKGPVTGSSSTRGIIAGGQTAAGYTNTIQYVTIASTGNATDFGDLTQAINEKGIGVSNNISFFRCGGGTSSGDTNVIDTVTIASTGNATDFGDMSAPSGAAGQAGASNAHGGLQ